jgi:hypothetical protein
MSDEMRVRRQGHSGFCDPSGSLRHFKLAVPVEGVACRGRDKNALTPSVKSTAMTPRPELAPIVSASPLGVVVLFVAFSLGSGCKSGRGPALVAPAAASKEPVALVDGPCPWLTARPDAAAGGGTPWRAMDRQLSEATLEEVLGRPARGFFRITGCWAGFLGSTTVVSFHAKSTPGTGWGPLLQSDVAGMIESLAKDLPGLGLAPRSSAYDLLGGSHEQDDNSNRTQLFLLRRRATDEYLLIRDHSG